MRQCKCAADFVTFWHSNYSHISAFIYVKLSLLGNGVFIYQSPKYNNANSYSEGTSHCFPNKYVLLLSYKSYWPCSSLQCESGITHIAFKYVFNLCELHMNIEKKRYRFKLIFQFCQPVLWCKPNICKEMWYRCFLF